MDREWVDPKEFAKRRNTPTPAERALWQELKGSKTGHKFSREIAIGLYFADFCSRQYRLVVEVDGDSHDRKPEDDKAREDGLRSRGYSVIRFTNTRVMEHPAEVIAEIKARIESLPRFRY